MAKKPKKRAAKPKDKRGNPPLKIRPDGKFDTGRPKIEIELDRVIMLCRFNPTDDELAAALDVSLETLKRRKLEPDFLAAMEHGKSLGRWSLRGKQWELAMKGEIKLLIHLGKNELGQSDKTMHANDPKHPFPSVLTLDMTRPDNGND